MRCWLIVAMAAALMGGNPALAQMPSVSPPGMLPTSPLGITGNAPVAPAGIPLGATELGTTGVSPMPFGSGTPCSATGSATSASPGVSSPTGTFDGGGIRAMGGTQTNGGATGMAAFASGGSPCAGTSSAGAMSSALSSPTVPVGGARTGIPLGSTEIENAGVSGVPAVPTPSGTPSNILPGSPTCTNSAGASTGVLSFPSGFPGVC